MVLDTLKKSFPSCIQLLNYYKLLIIIIKILWQSLLIFPAIIFSLKLSPKVIIAAKSWIQCGLVVILRTGILVLLEDDLA